MNPMDILQSAFLDEQPASMTAAPMSVAPEVIDEMQQPSMGKQIGMGALQGILGGNPAAGAIAGAAGGMQDGGMKDAVGGLSEALMEDDGSEKRKALLKMGITAMTGGAAAPFMGMI